MLKIWVVQLFEESSENLVAGGGRACKGGYSPTKGHQPSTWKRTKIYNPLQHILQWFWTNVIKISKSYFKNI